ncbi:uncharacterized protein LOC120081626 isoform X2 [Benincasa hispida]|uniref:uncharacterized protein LOC120081626 isoform X2 n=1 Tax=Benincasa hispida TaxID=102211 RepID=UPI001902600D|nr:uncharacterized protein LOC120081626 isoform X2 [Benincasa hispida]
MCDVGVAMQLNKVIYYKRENKNYSRWPLGASRAKSTGELFNHVLIMFGCAMTQSRTRFQILFLGLRSKRDLSKQCILEHYTSFRINMEQLEAKKSNQTSKEILKR